MFFIAVKLTKNETKIKITYKGYEKHSLERDNGVWYFICWECYSFFGVDTSLSKHNYRPWKLFLFESNKDSQI